ncbi:hypothetical protein [Amycolatopsis speibonae]|uniref:Uncharacterized protein n=1 Tax=Amycolatopsis speibonae TaxID=1450224 RepID=A0ABV7NZ97_9PSEU
MTRTSLTEGRLPDIRIGVAQGSSYGLFGPPETFVPQARELGAGIVRVNICWSQIEPEPDCFVWDTVDAVLEQLDGDVEAWVTVVSGSPWATRRSTKWLPASPAADAERYSRFVRAIAERGAGRIRFWQCEIEPCLPLFWDGTAEEYLAHLRLFRDAVKQADPEALVVLGGAVPGAMLGDGAAGTRTWATFFGQVLRGAAECFDIFDVHPYGDPYLVASLVEACHAQMAAHGYRKPVVVAEQGGPLPTEFPGNLPYLAEVLAVHQRQFLGQEPMPDTAETVAAAEDAAVVELYDRMGELPPALQMFMAGCPAELDAKRHRLACRDLVMRTVLALSAGARRSLSFPLAYERQLDSGSRVVAALMFDKLKLMDRVGDAIEHRYPAAETFELLARHLDGAGQVDRITVDDRPGLYLFEIPRIGRTPVLIVWERAATQDTDAVSATEFTREWAHPTACAVDVFGAEVPVERDGGTLRLSVSATPVFITSEPPEGAAPSDHAG